MSSRAFCAKCWWPAEALSSRAALPSTGRGFAPASVRHRDGVEINGGGKFLGNGRWSGAQVPCHVRVRRRRRQQEVGQALRQGMTCGGVGSEEAGGKWFGHGGPQAWEGLPAPALATNSLMSRFRARATPRPY